MPLPTAAQGNQALVYAAFLSGRLVYVVGPSGAGKDTVIAWAREHLPAGSAVHFAKRMVTRPALSGADGDVAATPEEFDAAQSRGEFAMAWKANGLRYGIAATMREWLARGTTVVVNGSRGYLPLALRDFPDLEVVLVTARTEVLRARLIARGREDAARIAERLARDVALQEGKVALRIVNDGDPADAGRLLLAHLAKER
jgi:ribose 1,5-bisphosphokinase